MIAKKLEFDTILKRAAGFSKSEEAAAELVALQPLHNADDIILLKKHVSAIAHNLYSKEV
jgi:hypothetical protein